MIRLSRPGLELGGLGSRMERVLLSITTVCGFSGKSFNRRPTLTTLDDRLRAVLFLVGSNSFEESRITETATKEVPHGA